MKKIIDAVRAWWRGEELEAEIHIPAPAIILLISIAVFFIVKACT